MSPRKTLAEGNREAWAVLAEQHELVAQRAEEADPSNTAIVRAGS